jgi:hypothetical protein
MDWILDRNLNTELLLQLADFEKDALAAKLA